ncbi:MAG: peptidyl-prolyl cis-trans isomerase [Prevotella sp.]|jgi:hypothetical protein|nr:peptidyl-prolyl cis-trans isomerase [Prevotella sp.]
MKDKCLVLFCALFFLLSCNKGSNSDIEQKQSPIVTVKDKTLYKSELDAIVTHSLSAEDSTAMAQAYIKMWINDQLIYEKAQKNVLNKEEIDKLVASYKKSLITNLYKEQLLKELLAKSASNSDLQAYYEQNKDRFKLKDNIVKGLYLKVPLNSKELDNFLKWYKQGTDAAIEKIEKNTLQNAVAYEYFYNKWVNLNDITDKMPLSINNGEEFLRTNKNVEARDSSFIYLLNIKEYKLIGNEAPYEYIKNQVTEVYTEQRKSDYLKKVRQDLYDKAVADKEITFYNK